MRFARPSTRFVIGALGLVIGIGPAVALAAEVPEPAEVLGFRPGEDFRLAPWDDVVAYFRKVDEASDRVLVRTIGTSTQGRPFLAAVVSSEETIANLDRYREMQHRLADPSYRPVATEKKAEELIVESKPTVLVTCSIHSSETASTLMATELLHEMATRNDPEAREIRDETILLLVPSVNPDGVDIVHDWYERSKGTPWEGSGMPWLYHPYAGHDTNRDWFMLNLKETRVLTRFLYEDWFPTITWDVHQMGSNGPRLFVPPFHDPINPNLDPRLNQGIFMIGAHLAASLAAEGKQGVATHVMYDNWWNGGNRTVPQRHNMVGILTEAASVKLASPIFLDRGDLRGGGRGFRDHELSVTFVDPWPGGWWRLRDIVDYELICARSLLTLAARYSDWFQSNYRAMALDAIEAGRSEPPYAWVVPGDQRDPGTAAKLVEILHATGITVHRAPAPFEAGGARFGPGSWIFPADQPFRPHLKDMMERQDYPRRIGPDGRPEQPYDVAGWTLPLQMGVKVVPIGEPFDVPGVPVGRVETGGGQIEGDAGSPIAFYLMNRANDDFIVLNECLKAGIPVDRLTEAARVGEISIPEGALRISATPEARRLLEEVLPGVSSVAIAASAPATTDEPAEIDRSEEVEPDEPERSKADRDRLAPHRIGLYQPWMPSMDEGWTRLVLENFRFPYQTLHNADIKAGDLADRIDVLVIPSIGARTIRDGYRPDQTEPSYVGGLEGEGVEAIRRFVEGGGTLLCLENSCRFAIEALELPVTEVLDDRSSDEFYCPGSIVGVRYPMASSHPLTVGMPDEGSAYFSNSLAFEIENEARDEVSIVCRYASTGLLESGWLLGPEHLEGKAAVVETSVGDGHVVLFGFPPQHRGQPHATFRPLFNGLVGALKSQTHTNTQERKDATKRQSQEHR